MKTAVSVPDPIFRAADRAARRIGISRSELYARALAAYLDKQRQAEVTAQLDRVYGDDPGPLDPVLAGLQIRALGVGEDW